MKEYLEDLQDELENNEAVLVDVREQNEWNAGHITGAIFVPLSTLKEGQYPNFEKIDKKKKYLYCRSGNRVHAAKSLLDSMGYKQVITLSEGFSELSAEGFPSE